MLIDSNGQVVSPKSKQSPILENQTPTDLRQKMLEQAKLRRSKLSGTRAHLQSLIQKKMRIEIEIKGLIKALQKQQRLQRKTLTEQFGLDPQDPNLEQKLNNLIDQDAELAHEIQEGDELIRKIAVNLEDATFLVETEVDKLKQLF